MRSRHWHEPDPTSRSVRCIRAYLGSLVANRGQGAPDRAVWMLPPGDTGSHPDMLSRLSSPANTEWVILIRAFQFTPSLRSLPRSLPSPSETWQGCNNVIKVETWYDLSFCCYDSTTCCPGLATNWQYSVKCPFCWETQTSQWVWQGRGWHKVWWRLW